MATRRLGTGPRSMRRAWSPRNGALRLQLRQERGDLDRRVDVRQHEPGLESRDARRFVMGRPKMVRPARRTAAAWRIEPGVECGAIGEAVQHCVVDRPVLVQHGRGEMAGIPSCRGGGLASELFVRGFVPGSNAPGEHRSRGVRHRVLPRRRLGSSGYFLAVFVLRTFVMAGVDRLSRLGTPEGWGGCRSTPSW